MSVATALIALHFIGGIQRAMTICPLVVAIPIASRGTPVGESPLPRAGVSLRLRYV